MVFSGFKWWYRFFFVRSLLLFSRMINSLVVLLSTLMEHLQCSVPRGFSVPRRSIDRAGVSRRHNKKHHPFAVALMP